MLLARLGDQAVPGGRGRQVVDRAGHRDRHLARAGVRGDRQRAVGEREERTAVHEAEIVAVALAGHELDQRSAELGLEHAHAQLAREPVGR